MFFPLVFVGVMSFTTGLMLYLRSTCKIERVPKLFAFGMIVAIISCDALPEALESMDAAICLSIVSASALCAARVSRFIHEMSVRRSPDTTLPVCSHGSHSFRICETFASSTLKPAVDAQNLDICQPCEDTPAAAPVGGVAIDIIAFLHVSMDSMLIGAASDVRSFVQISAAIGFCTFQDVFLVQSFLVKEGSKRAALRTWTCCTLALLSGALVPLAVADDAKNVLVAILCGIMLVFAAKIAPTPTLIDILGVMCIIGVNLFVHSVAFAIR